MTFIERVSGGSADAGSNVSTRPRSWRPSWQSFLFPTKFFFVVRTVFQLWNYGYILYVYFQFAWKVCWKAWICLQCTLEQNVSILAQVRLLFSWLADIYIYIYSITLLAFDIMIYCVFPKHDSDSRPFPPFPGPWCWGSKHSTMQTATTGWGTDAPVMIESNGQGHW